MINEITQSLIDSLIKVISKFHDGETLAYEHELGTTIRIHSLDDSIEFRYCTLGTSLIVSRIQFSNKRFGCMTACYNILIDEENRTSNKYDRIIIQAVSTYPMYCWGMKNGFNTDSSFIMEFESDGHKFPYGDYSKVI